jgi:hypothetical protein
MNAMRVLRVLPSLLCRELQDGFLERHKRNNGGITCDDGVSPVSRIVPVSLHLEPHLTESTTALSTRKHLSPDIIA